MARLIADVYAGKIDPRIAAGLAPLLNLHLRAIEMVDTATLERRMAEVEKLLTEKPEAEGGLDGKPRTHEDLVASDGKELIRTISVNLTPEEAANVVEKS